GEGQAPRVAVEQLQGAVRIAARQAAQGKADDFRHALVVTVETLGLAEAFRCPGDFQKQLGVLLTAMQVARQEGGQAEIACQCGKAHALPAQLLGEPALPLPEAEQPVALIGLRGAHQPQPLGLGLPRLLLAALQQVATVQTIQLGDFLAGIVVLQKRTPVPALGQQAQPAHLQLACLGQIAMFGEELAHLPVAGAGQASRQGVVGEIGFQRIAAQRHRVAPIRAGIPLAQRLAGFVVPLALLIEAGSLGGCAQPGGQQAKEQGEGFAHDTSRKSKAELSRVAVWMIDTGRPERCRPTSCVSQNDIPGWRNRPCFGCQGCRAGAGAGKENLVCLSDGGSGFSRDCARWAGSVFQSRRLGPAAPVRMPALFSEALMTLLKFTDVSLAYGAMPLLDRVSWQIARGERVCIIGRNGTGKSSLLQLVKGSQMPDDGEIWRAPALKIGELPQELPRADDRTVFDVVAEGLAEVGELLARYHHLSQHIQGDDDLTELTRVQQELEARDGWRLQQLVESTLSRLNLPADKTLAELSGGWRRRVLLAQALVSEPDLLL